MLTNFGLLPSFGMSRHYLHKKKHYRGNKNKNITGVNRTKKLQVDNQKKKLRGIRQNTPILQKGKDLFTKRNYKIKIRIPTRVAHW
jgi:pSer/pThr/pTyr-binding forkhead associated (FHA) protein